jgi:hypothetical protein
VSPVKDEGRIPRRRLPRAIDLVPSGTAPMTVKVEAIVKMLPPTDVPGLRAVLGTANYYWKFVNDYSTIAAPLNNLLREDVAWN